MIFSAVVFSFPHHIDICQSDTCPSTSFHSHLSDVPSLCSLFYCVKKKNKLISGLNCSGVYNLSSVFVLVSGAGLKCFWIKAQTTLICHVDTVYRAILFWWDSLVSSRFWQHWMETICYTWKKQTNWHYTAFLIGVYWLCYVLMYCNVSL